jgi:hypothetical protein
MKAKRRHQVQHSFLPDAPDKNPLVVRGFEDGKPTQSPDLVNAFSVPYFYESAWALYRFEEMLYNTKWSKFWYGKSYNDTDSLQIANKIISRYSKFLLLVQKYPEHILVPTHDIETCRQSQIIRPMPSRVDSNELEIFLDVPALTNDPLARDIYEPNLSCEEFYTRLEKTAELWENEYGERYTFLPIEKSEKTIHHMYYLDSPPIIDEEFFISWSEWIRSQTPSKWQSNLQEAEFVQDRMWYVWFRQYMKQTVGYVMSEALMKKCLKMYEKFLWIISKYVPGGDDEDVDGIVAPSFPIDIIWHTHMNNPSSYDRDCRTLMQMTGPCEHIPWPCSFADIIRIHASSGSYEADSVLWQREFGKKMDEDHIPE